MAVYQSVNQMRPQLIFRKIHKWLGLIIGIQILFWFMSGFIMSFMPIDEIHGDHFLKPKVTSTVSLSQLDLSRLANKLDEPVQSLLIKPWLGSTVVEVKTSTKTQLFDAVNLNLITPISEAQVRQVINANLAPELQIATINKLYEVPNEARGRSAPLWQVQLQGAENARIYISEQNGEIVAIRTNRWRLFDFMWMLHIMDYEDRTDFNHPLLYITAFTAMLFTLSGFVLLYYRFRKRRTPTKK
jgi:uncharacterized iron-regulated membrane protein